MKRVGCVLLFAAGAWAQQEEPPIKINLEGFRYPPIARSARIQGDVIFQVGTTDVDLVMGSRLLAGVAQTNLETWVLPPINGSYLVRYHFNLTNPGVRQEKVPIGNKFDRFFLNLFGAPTARSVSVCDYKPSTETHVREAINREGDDFVIDVFVTTRWAACLMPEMATGL